jgi:hypothetical protein
MQAHNDRQADDRQQAGALDEETMEYVVLVDTGSDWPDVVFVGSWEDAVAFDRRISAEQHSTSVQAVVTLD